MRAAVHSSSHMAHVLCLLLLLFHLDVAILLFFYVCVCVCVCVSRMSSLSAVGTGPSSVVSDTHALWKIQRSECQRQVAAPAAEVSSCRCPGGFCSLSPNSALPATVIEATMKVQDITSKPSTCSPCDRGGRGGLIFCRANPYILFKRAALL